jgi:putative methionine-R-sulfoxide reductase with GAF domain
MDPQGNCWAVLDVDSWEAGAFSPEDEDGLRTVLVAAGL